MSDSTPKTAAAPSSSEDVVDLATDVTEEVLADSEKRSWLNGPFLLGLAVTLGLLYYAAPKDPEEWRAAGTAFRTADYRTVPLFLLVLSVFYWLKAWRWRLLLRPIRSFSTRELAGPMMVGFAFNNVLPAHLGEFVRIFVFARKSDVAMSSSFSTVALERLFDLVAILTLLGLGLVLVDGIDPDVQRAGLLFAAATGVGVLGAAFYVFFTSTVLALIRWAFRILPLPNALEEKILSLAELGAEGLKSIRNPALFAGIVTTSFAQWILNGSLAWLALYAFGIEISVPLTCVLLGAIALAVTVPSTPGYFGVIQGVFWLVLQTVPALEARQGDIFAASIFYHLAQWVPVTVYGLWCFKRSGVGFADVQDAVRRRK